jgi:hypothetical protein
MYPSKGTKHVDQRLGDGLATRPAAAIISRLRSRGVHLAC